MKKAIAVITLVLLFTCTMVYSAPMPEIKKYAFQPTGQAYLYHYFGDECFDFYELDGKPNNSGAIVTYLPQGAEWDGFERRFATVYGEDRITNIRYKIDKDDFAQFPAKNAYAPFILNFEGQTDDTLIDDKNKQIIIYYPKDKSAVDLKFTGYLTNLGIAQYRAFPNGRSGAMTTSGGGILVSNKVSDLDTIFNSIQEIEAASEREKAYSNFSMLVGEILNEKVDYSKETYFYLIAGQFQLEAYKWNIALVRTNQKSVVKQPRLIPEKAVFDKRVLLRSNIIVNIIDNHSIPQKLFANGIEVKQGDNYAMNENYLVLNKSYLSTFNKGEKITFAIQFENGEKSEMIVEIIDTTKDAYAKKFNDVGPENEYWEFINLLYDKKVIKAGNGGAFRPKNNITYAELYDMLARALGYDTPNSLYDLTNIIKANINDSVTYNKAARLLVEILYEKTENKNIFKDVSVYDSYTVNGNTVQVDSYNAVTDKGININDDSFLFAFPMVDTNIAFENTPMTREEASKAIVRFINLLELTNPQKK